MLDACWRRASSPAAAAAPHMRATASGASAGSAKSGASTLTGATITEDGVRRDSSHGAVPLPRGGGTANPEALARACAEMLREIDASLDSRRVTLSDAPYQAHDDLNGYSFFINVPLERKRDFVELALADATLNRATGCMCGMGVGDALGHPFEFQPAQDAPGGVRFDLASLRFHGETNAFRLERGQWTDDAAMGLCMADSLILRQRFDGADMRVRFWCWWNRGYNNAFRKDRLRTSSVGLGANIAKSLRALSHLRKGERVPDTYDTGSEDAGNGSLMRFAPVALFLHTATWEQVHHYARMSSYTTHPGIIAAEACSLLAHLLVRALRLPPGEPTDVRRFLEDACAEYLEVSGLSAKSGWGYDQMKWLVTATPAHDKERCWSWKNESLDIAGTLRARGSRYNGYPVSAGYFGSYSLDGLAMALWSVYHTTSFDDAVSRSVNLLGDADSTGSITGQLAGAIYGYGAINPQFLSWLAKWDDHEFAVRAVLLNHLGVAAVAKAAAGTRTHE